MGCACSTLVQPFHGSPPSNKDNKTDDPQDQAEEFDVLLYSSSTLHLVPKSVLEQHQQRNHNPVVMPRFKETSFCTTTETSSAAEGTSTSIGAMTFLNMFEFDIPYTASDGVSTPSFTSSEEYRDVLCFVESSPSS
eukprot:PhF_6_TR18670/c0_g1_i1/m.27292